MTEWSVIIYFTWKRLSLGYRYMYKRIRRDLFLELIRQRGNETQTQIITTLLVPNPSLFSSQTNKQHKYIFSPNREATEFGLSDNYEHVKAQSKIYLGWDKCYLHIFLLPYSMTSPEPVHMNWVGNPMISLKNLPAPL